MIAPMKETIRQLAIIGPTASGKSDLAVTIAKEIDATVLSLDSFSLYKEIDIASAKLTLLEQDGIEHLGIALLYPNEPFDVTLFADLYQNAYARAQKKSKNLIIVGGTSFYLKILIDGISTLPTADKDTAKRIREAMQDKDGAYKMLCDLDPLYMEKIAPGDSYRIEKALTVFYLTGEAPSDYFRGNPPQSAIVGALPIYRITVEKSPLRERIRKRTAAMLEDGLIDEVAFLEKKYSRKPNCMKAIGIKETLDYFDGYYSRLELEEKITTNTARLAKRQTTFNRSQFGEHAAYESVELKERILKDFREK
jgi:tRNA dimethylallyltransferase